MGCGKSSVGRELATLLGCTAVDLDGVIEQRSGRKIPEIFETEGETAFRKMELEALREILDSSVVDLILSLGGGTLTTAECAELVHERTVCIYLRATIDTLVENLEEDGVANRPMLSGNSLRERITELMNARAQGYEKTAHYIIDIDGGTPSETAHRIMATTFPTRFHQNPERAKVPRGQAQMKGK